MRRRPFTLLVGLIASPGCGGDDAGASASGGGGSTVATTGSDGGDSSASSAGPLGQGECALLDPGWIVERIALDDEPRAAALALVDGEPAVAWVERPMNLVDALSFATRGSGWATEAVRGSDLGMGVPGLAVDGGGTVRILVSWEHSLGAAIDLATRSATAWSTETLAAVGSQRSPLVVRPDGSLLGLYTQTFQLVAVTIAEDGTVGTADIVDDGLTGDGGMATPGLGMDVGVATDGTIHIAHRNFAGDVLHASGGPGAWTRERVAADVEGETTALLLAEDGSVRLAFRDEIADTLVLATPSDGGWTTVPLESGDGAGAGLDAMRDAAGAHHLLQQRGDGVVRHGVDEGAGFVFSDVAIADEPDALALVPGADGAPLLLWARAAGLCVAQPP